MSDKILENYLARLQSEKVEFALGALRNPQDRTEFGFGLACGRIHGYDHAEQLLKDLMGEEDDE